MGIAVCCSADDENKESLKSHERDLNCINKAETLHKSPRFDNDKEWNSFPKSLTMRNRTPAKTKTPTKPSLRASIV